VADVQDMLQKVGAFDQGLLAAATSRTDVARVGQKLKISIFNSQEYATVIEFGRSPGSGKPPPLLPLVGWAGRKGIITSLPRNISFDGEWKKKWAASGAIFRAMKKGTKGKAKNSKPLDPQVRDLLIVRLIADKIFRKGSKGRHPFTIVFDRRVRTFRRDIAETMKLMK
jgi:hypothetical protein